MCVTFSQFFDLHYFLFFILLSFITLSHSWADSFVTVTMARHGITLTFLVFSVLTFVSVSSAFSEFNLNSASVDYDANMLRDTGTLLPADFIPFAIYLVVTLTLEILSTLSSHVDVPACRNFRRRRVKVIRTQSSSTRRHSKPLCSIIFKSGILAFFFLSASLRRLREGRFFIPIFSSDILVRTVFGYCIRLESLINKSIRRPAAAGVQDLSKRKKSENALRLAAGVEANPGPDSLETTSPADERFEHCFKFCNVQNYK
jgi:hypothetical protein